VDHLWNPWRYQYLQQAGKPSECIFCEKAAESDDERNLIVHRATHNFVILNLYPYTSGHMMVVPYLHVAWMEGAPDEVLQEMILLAKEGQRHLAELYHPNGYNIGMNLGEAAGAGIAQHMHMHVLPRWVGDASFVSVIGETRVIPEELPVTWKRLSEAFLAAR
jgi:ATP adenylyltransferase